MLQAVVIELQVFRFHAASEDHREDIGFQFDGEMFLLKKVVDHLRVADVVGELLVRALDLVALGKFERFEVDVIEAQGLGDLGEEAFRFDGKFRELFPHGEGEDRVVMVGGLAVAIAVGVGSLIVIVEEDDRVIAVHRAAHDIVSVAVFSGAQSIQKAVGSGDGAILRRAEAQSQLAGDELQGLLALLFLNVAEDAERNDGKEEQDEDEDDSSGHDIMKGHRENHDKRNGGCDL